MSSLRLLSGNDFKTFDSAIRFLGRTEGLKFSLPERNSVSSIKGNAYTILLNFKMFMARHGKANKINCMNVLSVSNL